MAGDKEPRTAAEWFEKGRQCFHQPDGMGAVKALQVSADRSTTSRTITSGRSLNRIFRNSRAGWASV